MIRQKRILTDAVQSDWCVRIRGSVSTDVRESKRYVQRINRVTRGIVRGGGMKGKKKPHSEEL